MDTLFAEMHFEVFRHFDLIQLLKISRLNKQYYGYLLNKKFWTVYLRYRSQAEYRRIVYKISKHGTVDLLEILDNDGDNRDYQDKAMEGRMLYKIWYNASIYDNKPIMEYMVDSISDEFKKCKDLKFEKLIKRVGSVYSYENVVSIWEFLKDKFRIKRSNIPPLWIFREILKRCHNYEILSCYLRVFKIDIQSLINIGFIETLVTSNYKHAYDLFISTITSLYNFIPIEYLQAFIYICRDRRICDYLIKGGFNTFTYQRIKNSYDGEPDWPKCEFYAIKLYKEVIGLYKDERQEEDYIFLWKLIRRLSIFVIEDQDITISMIEDLCDLEYSEDRLNKVISDAEDLEHDYLTIKLEEMKLRYDLN